MKKLVLKNLVRLIVNAMMSVDVIANNFYKDGIVYSFMKIKVIKL